MAQAATAHLDAEARWKPARHLMLLNDVLLLVARGDITRLIVTMPPRHGKSMLCSQYFPAWYLGLFPHNRIILASYAAERAVGFGRQARGLLQEYGPDAFGIRVSQVSSAANRWDIEGHQGGMLSLGVGGPATGAGCHLGIIDDPIKDAQEALSSLIRNRNEEWFKSTFYTRLMPGAAIVLIQTRWHDEDTAGWRIKKMKEGGEEWCVLDLPALAVDDNDILGRKVGEALWPEMYPKERLEAIRREIGTQWFEAEYQQRPLTEQGAMFKRGWFPRISAEQLPKNGEALRFWDLAATEARHGADPDYTAGAKLIKAGDKYYIADITRFRKTPHGVREKVVDAARADGYDCAIRMEEEGGSSGKSITYIYRTEVLPDYDFKGIRSQGSKVVRATNFSQAAESGRVYVVDAAWNKDFFDELEQFPLGSHDDQVDAVSGAFNQLARGQSVAVPIM